MQIHTPKFLYNVSVEYFKMGQARCNEIFAPNYQSDTSLFMKIPAPAAILSFAVELLMKSLLLLRKEEYPKTHNLLTLYTNVDAGDREKIELIFTNSSSENFKYPASRFVVEGHSPPESETSFPTTADEINYKLKQHDNSFVHWRYIASFSIDTSDRVRHYDFAFICKFYDAFLKHTKAIIWN